MAVPENPQSPAPAPAAAAKSGAGAFLRTSFLSGLAVLLPVALTLYVVEIVLSATDELALLLPHSLLTTYLTRIPGFGLLLAVTIIILVGTLARNIIGRWLVRRFHATMEHIPFIASVYKLSRQIGETFFGSSSKGFREVVLVEWPRRDTWTLAFVTAPVMPALKNRIDNSDEAWINLFIPTTPNPTSGFYFMVRRKDCIPAGMSVEEAFKTIISGGALAGPATQERG